MTLAFQLEKKKEGLNFPKKAENGLNFPKKAKNGLNFFKKAENGLNFPKKAVNGCCEWVKLPPKRLRIGAKETSEQESER